MRSNFYELKKDDFDRVASKLDISTNLVEDVYNSYFETVKNYMAMKTMPQIKTCVMTFYPSKYKFKKRFSNLASRGTKETLTKFVKSFWHVFDRLKVEKIKKATHLEWVALERNSIKKKEKDLYDLISKKYKK